MGFIKNLFHEVVDFSDAPVSNTRDKFNDIISMTSERTSNAAAKIAEKKAAAKGFYADKRIAISEAIATRAQNSADAQRMRAMEKNDRDKEKIVALNIKKEKNDKWVLQNDLRQLLEELVHIKDYLSHGNLLSDKDADMIRLSSQKISLDLGKIGTAKGHEICRIILSLRIVLNQGIKITNIDLALSLTADAIDSAKTL